MCVVNDGHLARLHSRRTRPNRSKPLPLRKLESTSPEESTHPTLPAKTMGPSMGTAFLQPRAAGNLRPEKPAGDARTEKPAMSLEERCALWSPSTSLSTTWVVFRDDAQQGRTPGVDFLGSLAAAGSCSDLAGLAQILQQLRTVVDRKTKNDRVNSRVFRDGITPVWEDPLNVGGGECVFSFSKTQDGAKIVQDVMQAIFLDNISGRDRNINGIVLSSRSWGHLLHIWLRRMPGHKNCEALKSELSSLLQQHSPKFVAFQSARDILAKGDGSSLHAFTGIAPVTLERDTLGDSVSSSDASAANTPSSVKTVSLVGDKDLSSPKSSSSEQSISLNGSPNSASSANKDLSSLGRSSERPGRRRPALSPQPKGPDGTTGFASIHSIHRRALLSQNTGDPDDSPQEECIVLDWGRTPPQSAVNAEAAVGNDASRAEKQEKRRVSAQQAAAAPTTEALQESGSEVASQAEPAPAEKWRCSCGWTNRPANKKCGGNNPTFGCGLERPGSNVLNSGAPSSKKSKPARKPRKSLPKLTTGHASEEGS